MRKLFCAISILAIAAPTSVSGQDYGLGGMDSFISASNNSMLMTNTIVNGATFRSSLKKNLKNKQSSAQPKGSASSRAAAPDAALNYKISASVRANSKEQFLTNMRSLDPQGAKIMEESFAKGDLFLAMDQELGKYGMRSNNVGDAMTVWLINMWMGANGLSQDPPATQIKAVRSQISGALTLSPDLAAATDRQKQELAEGLLLNAAVVGSALGDPRVKSGDMRAPLQQAMQKVGASMGLDLRAMKITDNGFVS